MPRPSTRHRTGGRLRTTPPRLATLLVAVALLAACTAPTTGTGAAADAGTATAATVPTPEPSESLITDAVGENTAVGELVAGFPADLVPVPDGAEVLVSSAEPLDSGMVRISLNLRTDQDVDGLLGAVRAPLAAAGFVEQTDPPEDGLAARSTFARGDGGELLVVGVLDRDGVRTMTLGGTVAGS